MVIYKVKPGGDARLVTRPTTVPRWDRARPTVAIASRNSLTSGLIRFESTTVDAGATSIDVADIALNDVR